MERAFMDIYGFLNSYAGRYLIQSFLHSLTAAVIVFALIKLWKIESPLLLQKFCCIVILLPMISFPVYHLLNPVRGEASFRMNALFDSSRWVDLALLGKVPVSLLPISLFVGMSLVLACKELINLAPQWIQSKKKYPVNAGVRSPVKGILSELHAPILDDCVIENDDPVLFTTLTGRKPTIVLSSGLLRILSHDQLKAALAHEAAHTTRHSRFILTLLFLIRMIMFYNPVTFIAFKIATLDEEKICDDIAALWTGKPQVLADALKSLCLSGEGAENVSGSVSIYGINMMIKDRVERLERKADQQVSLPWLKLALTSLTIGIINYYIV